jgi:hypothetical protein
MLTEVYSLIVEWTADINHISTSKAFSLLRSISIGPGVTWWSDTLRLDDSESNGMRSAQVAGDVSQRFVP